MIMIIYTNIPSSSRTEGYPSDLDQHSNKEEEEEEMYVPFDSN